MDTEALDELKFILKISQESNTNVFDQNALLSVFMQQVMRFVQFDDFASFYTKDGKSFCETERLFKQKNIIAVSDKTLNLLDDVKLFAETNSPVLISGESGSGKKLYAQQIYLNSDRIGKSFLSVNCFSLSENFDEEVFGRESSGDQEKTGLLRKADGGVLFIQHIENLSLENQEKILSLIKNKSYSKCGSSELIPCDIKIIVSSDADLDALVSQGKFREDFYYLLNLNRLHVPSLKERPEDLDELALSFLKHYARLSDKKIEGFSESALQLIHDYSWPGNVRELKNAVERAVIICKGLKITTADLSFIDFNNQNVEEFSQNEAASVMESSEDKTLKTALDSFKKSYVEKILKEQGWNQTKAAKILDIQRTYVSRLMNELHIRKK